MLASHVEQVIAYSVTEETYVWACIGGAAAFLSRFEIRKLLSPSHLLEAGLCGYLGLVVASWLAYYTAYIADDPLSNSFLNSFVVVLISLTALHCKMTRTDVFTCMTPRAAQRRRAAEQRLRTRGGGSAPAGADGSTGAARAQGGTTRRAPAGPRVCG